MNSHQRRKSYRKLCRSCGGNPTLISNWGELALVPESATHTLDIDVDGCNGWINKKGEDKGDMGHYLSTHTFYGKQYKRSTALLQKCGFNVRIANWDALEREEVK